MNKYHVIKWEPISNIPSRLHLEGLYDDYEGFRLLLKGERKSDKLLLVKFKSQIGYRNVDESNRIKTLLENPILTTQWPFFISRNNDFLEWITSQSSGTLDENKSYTNYIICTPNDIVEILSAEEPTFEWTIA